MYKNLRNAWKRPKENMAEGWRKRLVKWRKEGTITRAERPTRIDRARSLGYKAKEGYVVVRVRVKKGLRKKPKTGGRRPKTSGRFYSTRLSGQVIGEQKVARKYKNCEVLNSYYVGEDGSYKWFECILVERSNPVIRASRSISWISDNKQRGRAFRGLTR